MKRFLCLILSVILMLSVMGCAAATPPAPTEPDYTAVLSEAEKLYKAGNMEAAVAKFAEAGEEGQTRILEIREEYRKEMLNEAHSFYKTTEERLAMLKNVPQGLADEEILKQWTLEVFRTILEEYETDINDSTGRVHPVETVTELQELSDAIAASSIAGTPEAQSMADTSTMLRGLVVWYLAEETRDWEDPGLEEAYQIFLSCSEGSAGHEIGLAIGMIREGAYVDGVTILKKHIVSQYTTLYMLSRYAKKVTERSMNERLEYDLAYTIADNESRYIGTLTEMIPSTDRYRYGVSEGNGLPDDLVKELKTLCGDAPEGKILVLHRWSQYGTGSKKVDTADGFMDKLPEEYYPRSLEQVEYVILVDVSYYSNGVFNNGTVRIQETATLTLYAVNGTVLYKKTVQGETGDTMYYQGTPPEFYSPGSPDMTEAIQEALAVIAGR